MSETIKDSCLAVLRDTSSAYESGLRNGEENSWPSLTVVAVTVKRSSNIDTKEALESANARKAEGWQGWIRFRSGIRGTGDAASSGDDEQLGPPLAGEWTRGNESVHLRPHSHEQGMLQEWHYVERRLGNQDEVRDGEQPALCQRIAVLARLPDPKDQTSADLDCQQHLTREKPVLIYHVYWGTAPDETPYALRRLFARYAGMQFLTEFDGKNIVVGPGETG